MITISAAGAPGASGIKSWDGTRNFDAPDGYNGRHGRDSSFPEQGADGRDVQVRLGYIANRPGCVQVFGQGTMTGNRWEVDGEESVFVDSRGGDGGDGGWGENGQTGGQGYPGTDATEDDDATIGGCGLTGGSGGRGTNGANGGRGGKIHVTVAEDDLDTLVAVTWSTGGGKGGASGVHGKAGAGGRGGFGGSGYSWTETRGRSMMMPDGNGGTYQQTTYLTVEHSRPGESAGPQGPPGARPPNTLSAGRPGSNGTGHITVLGNNHTQATYASRYQLRVVSFNVVDENDDGIHEPGEFLHVKNLVIENNGAMPSPKGSGLSVSIQPTEWLQPVADEALHIPSAISPGATMRVPGILRAFIKNEDLTRSPRTSFRVSDTVKLVAVFDRLERPLPEFVAEAKVVYQYPLIIDEMPVYLDCVSRGQLVRFSWKLRNISTKPHGTLASNPRVVGTRMADPGGIFDLAYASKDNPHQATRFVESLGPGEEVSITQDFNVSHAIQPFTNGQLCISLLLSDPHKLQDMRMIQHFNLPIQISAAYSYSPLSRFLLVMNVSTPNKLVTQTIEFIENGLHAPVDLFNISLAGSFVNPDTNENVLGQYTGKTVIIFGNAMQYFQNGTREPWDLLDPWQACEYANNGTNFLFLETANTDGLQQWSQEMAMPAYSVSPPAEIDNITAPKLISSISANGDPNEPRDLDQVYTLPVKKPLFRNLEKVMESKATSVQKILDKQLPLRRFLVVPCSDDEDSSTKLGTIAIVEGLPHKAKLAAGIEEFDPEGTSLGGYNTGLITHSLPFEDQCHIFWNILSALEDREETEDDGDSDDGENTPSPVVAAKVAYAGEKLARYLANPKFSDTATTEYTLDPTVLKSLCWSIATQLNTELTRLCLKSPWPDTSLSKPTILSSLPLLNTFVASPPSSLEISTALPITSLASILGPLVGSYNPSSARQWMGQNVVRLGNRRTKVRSVAKAQAISLVQNVVAGKKRAKLARSIINLHANTAKENLNYLRNFNKYHRMHRVDRVHELSCSGLSDLAGTAEATYYNLNDSGVVRSVAPGRYGANKMRATQLARLESIKSDTEWSAGLLEEIINPDG